MSLINDALKRARESQQQNPSANVPPPLLPVEPGSRRGGGEWMLILAAILFATAICLFISLMIFKHKNVPPPLPVVAAPAPVVPVIQTQEIAAPTPPPAAEKYESDEYLPKIQGIFFDPAHPVAIVNRMTVHVGDSVGDYQINAISRNSVTFRRRDGSLKEVQIGD